MNQYRSTLLISLLTAFSLTSYAQNRIEGKVSPTAIIINGKMTYEVKIKNMTDWID